MLFKLFSPLLCDAVMHQHYSITKAWNLNYFLTNMCADIGIANFINSLL